MKTSTSPKGIIAAGHAETARAGQIILQQGGNAFDAALAACLASFVSEPSLTSLGGGGFMTAVQANGHATLYDFFVQTPQHRKPIEEVEFVESMINFGTTVQAQFIGRGAAAVYGCPAGISHIHEQLGSLPFSEIAAPALALCKQGVVITPYQAYTIAILEAVLMFGEESMETFCKDGRLILEGERLFRPRLADTLDAYVKEGKNLFYHGEIAQRYAQDSREHGGSVFLEDLHAYQIFERRPKRLDLNQLAVLTNPPPSAGGSLITHGLSFLQEKGMPGSSGPAYIKRLADAMREMEDFREHKLDLLGNTTHISVMDVQGNAASITTTLGGASGRNIPGTGIPNNNMLGETDLHPGGPYQWQEDQRVTSMMSPTIVLRDGKPAIVTGSGGSSRIRTALLQVLTNLTRHGMSVQEAVNHPRIHWEKGLLNIEPGLLEEGEILDMPESEQKPWAEKNMFFGGAHTVVRTPDGSLDGCADPRRDGAVRFGE